MSGNKVIKPVSFNITKSNDAAMLKFIARKNFSGYVKKLIMADMGKEPNQVVEATEMVTHEVKPVSKLEQAKQKSESNKPAPPTLLINQKKHQ